MTRYKFNCTECSDKNEPCVLIIETDEVITNDPTKCPFTGDNAKFEREKDGNYKACKV